MVVKRREHKELMVAVLIQHRKLRPAVNPERKPEALEVNDFDRLPLALFLCHYAAGAEVVHRGTSPIVGINDNRPAEHGGLLSVWGGLQKSYGIEYS